MKLNSKGSVSVYLCIVMSSLILVGGVFADLSRIKSAKIVAGDISVSVARSVLSNYEELLYEAYGIHGLTLNQESVDLARSLVSANITATGVDPFRFEVETLHLRKNGTLGENDEFKKQAVRHTINDIAEDWIGSKLEAFEILKLLSDNKNLLTSLMPSSDMEAADAYKQVESALKESGELGGALNNVVSQLLLNEYIIRHFSNSTGFENVISIRDGETERIITGAKSDNEAKVKVIAIISGLRFALNAGFFLTDPILMQKAAAYAVTVAGWTGVGVPIAQAGIIVAWCLAESALDVKLLLEGKRVPLVKNQTTWILSESGLIDQAADSLMGIARKATDNAIDSTFDTVEEMVKQAISEVRLKLEAELNNFIDCLFSPLELELEKLEATTEESLEQLLNQFLEEAEKSLVISKEDGIVVELLKGYAVDWLRVTRERLKLKISDYLGKPIEILNDFKKDISNTLTRPLEDLEDELIHKINQAAEKGKEALKEQISGLFPKGKENIASSNLTASFFTMQYKDYLRLLLLTAPEDKKINRIRDIINANMREALDDNDFSFEELVAGVELKLNYAIPCFILSAEPVKNGRFYIRKRVVMSYESGYVRDG